MVASAPSGLGSNVINKYQLLIASLELINRIKKEIFFFLPIRNMRGWHVR